MLNPCESLFRCDEIMPELQLGVEEVTPDVVIIRKIQMKEWGFVYSKCLDYVKVIHESMQNMPDIPPFCVLREFMEDIGAMIHSLFIFYDCTMRQRNRSNNRD